MRLREQHDKRRQVLVLTAETVAEPGAHTWPSWLLKSSLDERDRRIVVDRIRVHCFDDGDVIDDLCGVRQELADPGTCLTVPAERKRRLRDRQRRLAHRLGNALALPHRVGNLGALELREPWLVVKRLEL